METNQATILNEIKKLVEGQQKAKNVTIAPMFIRDNNIELDEDEIAVSDAVSEVLFMRKEQSIETMTLDTGCPPNLVSEDWLLKYLRENNMRREELKSMSCNQKFRFGPRSTYTVAATKKGTITKYSQTLKTR